LLLCCCNSCLLLRLCLSLCGLHLLLLLLLLVLLHVA
jgi:hypothetical protein